MCVNSHISSPHLRNKRSGDENSGSQNDQVMLETKKNSFSCINKTKLRSGNYSHIGSFLLRIREERSCTILQVGDNKHSCRNKITVFFFFFFMAGIMNCKAKTRRMKAETDDPKLSFCTSNGKKGSSRNLLSENLHNSPTTQKRILQRIL